MSDATIESAGYIFGMSDHAWAKVQEDFRIIARLRDDARAENMAGDSELDYGIPTDLMDEIRRQAIFDYRQAVLGGV